MTELCHVCDLFRTALFGPTNSSEDHLDDGLGNDLPRPMADAPAMIGGRSRSRPSSMKNAKPERNPDAVAQPVGCNGATATPSVTSEAAHPTTTVLVATPVAVGKVDSPPIVDAPVGKPVVRTNFKIRNSRGMKSPAYMSFDDVDIEEDDSDGELFVDDHHASASASRSPGGFAAAYSVSKSNVPSVYREPDLTATDSKEPTARSDGAPHPPGYIAQTKADSRNDVDPGAMVSSDHLIVEAGASMETFPTATGGDMAMRLSGMGIGEDGVSIPRNESSVDSARPHGQSESFHGYKGYPGYEPETPVAEPLIVGRPEATESLAINPAPEIQAEAGAENVKGHITAPMPSGSRYNPQAATLDAGKHAGAPVYADYTYGESQPHHRQLSSDVNPGMVDMDRPGGSDFNINSSRQHQQQQQQHHQLYQHNQQHQHYHQQQHYQQQHQHHPNMNTGPGMSHSSHVSGAFHDRVSPAPSGAGSMASSVRRDTGSQNIQQTPSEDMGSLIGMVPGAEDSQNEDLQWKRSALKKFHKVMVKGEGLRVVKHNRAGGSQVRIIRYDPEMKALVWNSKRYMKKAGSANVPIMGIKRVGREGNTVSVTAAGRGTIGFEPQRIRDAKILAEALRALVDKEERSAMWRG